MKHTFHWGGLSTLLAWLPALVVLTAAPHSHAGGAFGIDSRTPNTSLLIDEVPALVPGDLTTERVFPNLSFDRPLFLTHAGDASGRLFLVEQRGVIYTFPNSGNPGPGDRTIFLNLLDRVRAPGAGGGNEEGLLGLAFDPDYATNGIFYCYYSAGTSSATRRSVIARYTNDNPADNSTDRATEEVIMEISQPFSNHNGGMIAFGPDDMLYIATGDGGSGGDPLNSGQDTTTLLGNVLRIDVRSTPANPITQNYVIPPDNPFVGGGPAGTNTREEIWAYGLRNPYRFSFDMLRGILFLGDVGQGELEEIDVIEKGLNYGWRIMEGTDCFNPSSGCNMTGLTLPIAEYSHSLGLAVTGGYVYYGSRLSDLFGVYLYGDYSSGRIWGLKYEDGVVLDNRLLADTGHLITSWGQDADGEVYLTDFITGGIFRLISAEIQPPVEFPERLSEIPALLAAGSGTDQTNAGIYPYEPVSPLWSDGALKERFIALPGSTQIGYTEFDGWNFPEDSVIIKNFLLPQDFRDPAGTAKRVETRLLIRDGGIWNGFTYEWLDDESDAILLPSSKERSFSLIDENGQPFDYQYYYPSRFECVRCHTPAANFMLGLSTAQLNSELEYPASGVTDNQLRTLDHINLFTSALPDVPANLPSLGSYMDPNESAEMRTRHYLSSNCSMCHRPGGGTPANMDLRWYTDLASTNMIDATPTQGDLGIPGARIVKRGVPGESILAERIQRLDQHRMPPLASSRVDEDSVEFIEAWIRSLGSAGTSAWLLYE